MPNNAPGVHVIWLICLALGIPVVIRPGSSEPFTPYRLIQAFIKAGFPKEVFGFFPCDYAGADRIPEITGGAIVFGGNDTVDKWKSQPGVQVHGAGFSKVLIGEDLADEWERLARGIADNIASNSGRSCFAPSLVMVPRHGRDLAQAIARRNAERLRLLERTNSEALLSAMSMPKVAGGVNQLIEEALSQDGAEDMSAELYPSGGRLQVAEDGRTFLMPTTIFCDSIDHSLAQKEFLFPFAAVVEISNEEALERMGPTLALAAHTKDSDLKNRLARSQVSLVSINQPTSILDRRQPHEEQLFDEVLYRRLSWVEGA